MKKKFTFLIAALMLLTMIFQPGNVMADEGDTHDFSQSISQNLNDNAAIDPINISAQTYPVKSVIITCRYNKSINDAVTINVSVGGASWGSQNVGNNFNNTKTFDGASTTGAISISFTNNTGSGSKHGTFYVTNVRLVEGPSDPTLTIASVTGGTIAVTNTSTSANVASGSKVASGTGLTLSNSPSTGYSFTEWNVYKTVDASTHPSMTGTNTFNMPTYSTTVSATFTKNNYKVTLGKPGVGLSATDFDDISLEEEDEELVPYGTVLYLEAGSLESDEMFVWKVTKTGVSPEVDVTNAVLSDVSANAALLTVPDYAITVNGTVESIKYFVTYNANGGAGTLVDPNSPYTPGDDVTVLANTFTYSGYVFAIWNTKADGTGDDYNPDDEILDINADVTLYAQWVDAWTVTLNSNAAITIKEVEKTHSITLIDPENVPSGYVFKWWTATPSMPQIMLNSPYTPTANVTLYAVFAKSIQEYNEMSVILDGSELSTTATSSATSITDEGISYTVSDGAKKTSVPGTASNEFTGVTDAILVGKTGKYIYNTTPFGNGITKFEVYANKGVSTNVTVGVYFKTTSIDSYNTGSNTWTQKFAEDTKYDASSKMPNGAKYFWFQVTNDYNAQVAFRITYLAPAYYTRIYPSGDIAPDEDMTITTPTVISNGTILNMGTHTLSIGTGGSLTIENGGQLILNSDNTDVKATVKKTIIAVPSSKDATNKGWHSISSPVNNASVEDNTNLVTASAYDLYMFDESEENLQWINYNQANSTHGFTNMTNGRGYIYRNESAVTATYTGTVNAADVECSVTKTENTPFSGFNLVGNPYTQKIKLANTQLLNGATPLDVEDQLVGYYVADIDGGWGTQLGTDNEIDPAQGFLVQVPENATKIKFSTTKFRSRANDDNLMFRVENSEYSDVTYAMFDKGYGLSKISHRNSEIPMLYIPQNGEDYAIAMMSDDTKAFNLNFKAMTTGKYTLSYKADGNFGYLHVIDRLTGEDVDMLLNNEYEFVASKNDNANRFIVRLAYSAISENSEDDIFAYQNGSDIVVTGEGELQIFDVMGRMIASQHVNGVETINVKSQGVYIFRLNGMTQKIVVR